jgi:hypothetical protein
VNGRVPASAASSVVCASPSLPASQHTATRPVYPARCDVPRDVDAVCPPMQMGFAVFTENSTLLEHASTLWGQRVPSYFYNFAQDGGRPVPAPRGVADWYGQTVFNATTSGICQVCVVVGLVCAVVVCVCCVCFCVLLSVLSVLLLLSLLLLLLLFLLLSMLLLLLL